MLEIMIPLFILSSTHSHIYFRSINCLVITYMSGVAVAINGILDLCDWSKKDLMASQLIIRMLSMYGVMYISLDLYKILQKPTIRKDLFFHHVVVFFWILFNWNTGATALCLMNEIITTSYMLSNARQQYIFRIGAILAVRYPIWFTAYSMNPYTVNSIVSLCMMLLDLFWLWIYSKRLMALTNK